MTDWQSMEYADSMKLIETEPRLINATIVNPGSEFEFYETTVTSSNSWGSKTNEHRCFTLDANGRAVPVPNPQYGSASVHTQIPDPF